MKFKVYDKSEIQYLTILRPLLGDSILVTSKISTVHADVKATNENDQVHPEDSISTMEDPKATRDPNAQRR